MNPFVHLMRSIKHAVTSINKHLELKIEIRVYPGSSIVVRPIVMILGLIGLPFKHGMLQIGHGHLKEKKNYRI